MTLLLSTQDMLPSEATFLAAMQQLGFGRFEYLQIRGGELVLDPWPTAIRDIKFATAPNTGKAAEPNSDLRPQVAEFFSFGTNDLTQTTLGLSRDDAGSFLPKYVEEGIFPADPFQTLDQEGVGQLVEMAVERGRAARADLKLGICGEHGGDPKSVDFFHRVGLDYVSCSPYRVPVARLAAAHAALAARRAGG